MRFYPGLSLSEVRSMTAEDNQNLWLAIDNLEAQEMLAALQVSVYPHMKQKAQEKVLSRLNKMAYPEPETEKKTLNTEELAKALNDRLRR